MTRHLAKLLDAIWYISMGLFLGLTAGLVVGVIAAFHRSETMDARPGIEPFNDPRFVEHHNDAVAGAIGQDLFFYGGIAALVLLGIAILARLGYGLVIMLHQQNMVGSKKATWLRGVALCICAALMVVAAGITNEMNNSWPGLYEPQANQGHLDKMRSRFDSMHHGSERIVRIAWGCAFITLIVSPWCRRIADMPKAETK